MSRDLHRERLLAKLYSREGATEPARDYLDPTTGTILHITPGEWELLQYDRAHPSDTTAPSYATSEHGVGSRVTRTSEQSAERSAERSSARSSEQPAEQPAGGRSRRRRIAIAVALVVAGCIVGAAVTLAVVLARPALVGGAGRSSASGPITGIHSVFSSGDFASSDPGQLAAVGFHRGSFRLVGDEVVYDRTGQVFAARRDDGQYCLVLVAGLVRVTETCATAQGIGETGLTLQDTTREADGSLLTFTARWNRNGEITWKLVETSH